MANGDGTILLRGRGGRDGDGRRDERGGWVEAEGNEACGFHLV